MAPYKKYSLADTTQSADLRQFEEQIVKAIEAVAPGKHPKVFQDCFITDNLSHSESVRIGRELSRYKELARYGKTIETFRLFKGQTIEVEEAEDGGTANE